MAEAMEVDQPDAKKEEVPKETKDAKKKEDLDVITFENMKEWCNQLERGEVHIVGRVLQFLNRTRRQLNPELLTKLCSSYLGNNQVKKNLLGWLPKAADTSMEVDSKDKKTPSSAKKLLSRKSTPTPELELYIHLLVLLFLTDEKKHELALQCANSLIECADGHDKRSLDPFLAKGFFYLTLISERTGKMGDLPPYLNSRLRFATLRHQYDSQATLIVCLLRIYLVTKNLLSASKLITKVKFPESANNNDLARYLYYWGRIRALQLQYVEAADLFQLSLRKSPQDSAVGFKQNVHKWVVVISLLRGEIPERAIFRVPIHRVTLQPYLQLTHAVRLGDIALFNKVLEKYSGVFETDETLTLIVRLRQNVIRTAIRQISLAYSRIPISDIAKKLQLPTEIEAEYIVAKAIKDHTVDAIITCDSRTDSRYLQSGVSENLYRTTEPQYAYDTRIKNCLELHNLAVKALRYPDNKKPENEKTEQQRERELLELELASEMPDDDDEF
ncbi:unnamed protein product [Bursaphelenchus okinawaensis]|uniref:PCI domain-containing protein n=1 Tax=Bursaphelenchus okinawaensis TaxID=465554 RepID=A0A811JV20_9BILA|nr:unnamed protein product [Bursaphelenchus okinawaensis]CAG9083735.1 unnamed protein product [Bursaphelenchus okinawaensis]